MLENFRANVLKAGTHEATSRNDRSLRQVAPCVLLAKQVAATRRLLAAHAVISIEEECELGELVF